MRPGNAIFLNGTSSAGKTSLAQALQEVLPAPYLHLSADHLGALFPGQWRAFLAAGEAIPPRAREGVAVVATRRDGVLEAIDIRRGPANRRFWAGVHRAIAAFARVGNHVIVDHLLVGPDLRDDCVRALAGLPVLSVGVRCPLAVAQERERARGDRDLGLVAWQYARVHAGVIYDVEVDTARGTPLACARQVAAALQRPPSPRAFELLRRGLARSR